MSGGRLGGPALLRCRRLEDEAERSVIGKNSVGMVMHELDPADEAQIKRRQQESYEALMLFSHC
jgi:hypothetical protein